MHIFLNHGKTILSNSYFLLSRLYRPKYLRVDVAQWRGEPVYIQTNSADEGGGLGLVVLSGCGLEDADQISPVLSFCGQRTADVCMSSLQNLVCPRTRQGKRLVGGRNSRLLSDWWPLDRLYHRKPLTFDIMPQLASPGSVNYQGIS